MTGTLVMPTSLVEAVDFRLAHPNARLIAGGTDVVADVNRGDPPTGFVSLRGLPELRGLQQEGGQWRLGAMCTVAEVRANGQLAPPSSALGHATRSLASRQIRNSATVGGNICGGGPQRTLIPVLLAYNAVVDVVGRQGQRSMPLSEVLAPEGTLLAEDEILMAVRFTPATGPQRYYRVGPRNAVCYATASVSVVVDEPTRSVRLALGSVAPTAVRSPSAEAIAASGIDWKARRVDDDVAKAFGAAAAQSADPVTDVAASADYRRHAIAVMARRALRHLFEEDPA